MEPRDLDDLIRRLHRAAGSNDSQVLDAAVDDLATHIREIEHELDGYVERSANDADAYRDLADLERENADLRQQVASLQAGRIVVSEETWDLMCSDEPDLEAQAKLTALFRLHPPSGGFARRYIGAHLKEATDRKHAEHTRLAGEYTRYVDDEPGQGDQS